MLALLALLAQAAPVPDGLGIDPAAAAPLAVAVATLGVVVRWFMRFIERQGKQFVEAMKAEREQCGLDRAAHAAALTTVVEAFEKRSEQDREDRERDRAVRREVAERQAKSAAELQQALLSLARERRDDRDRDAHGSGGYPHPGNDRGGAT